MCVCVCGNHWIVCNKTTPPHLVEPGQQDDRCCPCPPGTSAVTSSRGKCYRAGKFTQNPFFNYLRKYRIEHRGMTITQIAQKGAREWKRMDNTEKEIYISEATCIQQHNQVLKEMNRSRRIPRKILTKKSKSRNMKTKNVQRKKQPKN